jgi:hypothetical protein
LRVGCNADGLLLLILGLRLHVDVLMGLGALCIATSIALHWVLHDPAAPKPAPIPARAPQPGDIASMTDAEFDELLDEVERDARGPVRAPRPPDPLRCAHSVPLSVPTRVWTRAEERAVYVVEHPGRAGNSVLTISPPTAPRSLPAGSRTSA